MYCHDVAGTGYSPLKQITVRNAVSLKRAWTYPLQGNAPGPASKGNSAANADSEATPIFVNGVMYFPAAGRVVALEPETGKDIWSFPINGVSRRGVAFRPAEGAIHYRKYRKYGAGKKRDPRLVSLLKTRGTRCLSNTLSLVDRRGI